MVSWYDPDHASERAIEDRDRWLEAGEDPPDEDERRIEDAGWPARGYPIKEDE